MVWLTRVVNRLHAHPGPIVLEGGEAYGAPFLVQALAETQQLAWLELTPADASDYIAINNRLADAVNQALGRTLLAHALPFTYSLEILKNRLPLLGPLHIACSNADYNPIFRDSLLALQRAGAKIILIADHTAEDMSEGLLLRAADLALTAEEAEALAGPYLTDDERRVLWRSSGGAYVPFMHSICRFHGEPLPRIPSPRGDLVPHGEEELVAPEDLLEVLLDLERYGEALELAVMCLPDRIADFIAAAGQEFLARGTLARLHLLLESLDEPFQRGEKMLEWRLVAAFSRGDHARLLPVIEAYLEENEAPELRARYAGQLHDTDLRLAQAQRAATAAATPLTLYQLGRLHPDDKVGSKILQRSVTLAEKYGRPYDIARNAGALAESLSYSGKFQEAASWSEWALEVFDKAGIEDGSMRLLLIDANASARIFSNQLDGLKRILLEAKDAFELADTGAAKNFRFTLSQLELVTHNFTEAAALATTNYRQSPRWNIGRFAVPLVRILLEQGKTSEALDKAQHAYHLTAEEDAYYALPAALALGMVYTLTKPEAARSLLFSVLQASELEATLRVSAALHLLKLGAVKLSELDADMRAILVSLTLTAFHLLSGPAPEFAAVWEELTQQHAKLRIRSLGQEEVWFNGERVDLSGRALEVLVLLALHPHGLSSEALHARLYSDEETKLVALRSAVSRLRSLIPISSHPQPYKITVPFEFDVQSCEAALAAGDVRTALEHYQGSLFGKSDAPGIREARETLEERVRQSVLQSGDPDTLLFLAEALRDDLELWQALHTTLATGDARLPAVKAQLLRVTQELQPHYN